MVLQTFIKWMMCTRLLEAGKAHFLKIVKKKQSGLVTYAFSSQKFWLFFSSPGGHDMYLQFRQGTDFILDAGLWEPLF